MTNQDQTGSRAANAPGILLIICVAIFFGVLNASALGVVLPDIADDLSVGTAQISWLMTGFLQANHVHGRTHVKQGRYRGDQVGSNPTSIGSFASTVQNSRAISRHWARLAGR